MRRRMATPLLQKYQTQLENTPKFVYFRSIGDYNEMERNLPMKRRFATLRLVFALCAIVTLTISKVSGQDANYEKAVAHATQIIKTKIFPEYETKGGFKVKPMDIKYDKDPTMQNILMNLGQSRNGSTR
jgi:hypothetical protein